jgi:hypothetical protein
VSALLAEEVYRRSIAGRWRRKLEARCDAAKRDEIIQTLCVVV